MSDPRELNKAIVAHGGWKIRLRDAIDTGRSDFTPEVVRSPHECDFGKWLKTLSVIDKSSDFYQKIVPLHEKFHTEASRILSLALTGHKEQALSALTEITSDFTQVSSGLVNALTEWKSISR